MLQALIHRIVRAFQRWQYLRTPRAVFVPTVASFKSGWTATMEKLERESYLDNPLACWLRPDRHEHKVPCWQVEGFWKVSPSPLNNCGLAGSQWKWSSGSPAVEVGRIYNTTDCWWHCAQYLEQCGIVPCIAIGAALRNSHLPGTSQHYAAKHFAEGNGKVHPRDDFKERRLAIRESNYDALRAMRQRAYHRSELGQFANIFLV